MAVFPAGIPWHSWFLSSCPGEALCFWRLSPSGSRQSSSAQTGADNKGAGNSSVREPYEQEPSTRQEASCERSPALTWTSCWTPSGPPPSLQSCFWKGRSKTGEQLLNCRTLLVPQASGCIRRWGPGANSTLQHYSSIESIHFPKILSLLMANRNYFQNS